MEYAIQIDHLTKTYDGRKAIDQVSIAVGRGEIFGLLGANGAGKSTTLECALGTRAPDAGRVEILGMSPVNDRKRLFERVGVQFQEGSYQERIKVAELCEVTSALYRRPLDYLTLLKQFTLEEKQQNLVSELSGGQRQRLFIVLALIPGPEVVFLDELTTGLDAKARRNVWKHLAALKAGGVTVLLSSHFMDEVEALCDRICILRGGSAVFTGTVAQAVASSPHETFEEAYLWHAGDMEEDEDEDI